MRSFLRGYSLAVPMCLLLPICSCLVLFSLAQSNQDQNQPVATLSLNAQYSAEVSSWTDGVQPSDCEDKITLTYGGTVRWKLLPAGYGTPHVDPAVLGVHWGKSINAERTGAFTISYEGGGQCTFKKPTFAIPTPPPAPVSWTYGTKSTQVDPAGFPGVSVNLRRGEYNVDSGVGNGGELTVNGGFNGLPGPAWQVLVSLQEQSLMKVAEITTGKFEPFSKDFQVSKSVSNTIDWPPTPANAKGGGEMSFSYTLTVGAPEEVEAVIIPPDDYEGWIPQGPQEVQAPSGPAPPVEPPPIAAAMFGGGVMLASLANLAGPLPPTGGPGQGGGPAVATAVEDLIGNKLEGVKVVLQKKGQKGGKTAQGARFTVELVGTSQEPGVCLNWPPPAQLKKPSPFDLEIDVKNNPFFDPSQSADTYPQTAVTRANTLHELKFSVLSHDWGAYGKLKVTVQLQDGSPPFDAHLEGKPNVTEMPIPLDDNGNHIAHAWTKENVVHYGSTNADADDEDLPVGDGDEGDGLSLYEEYRGFMMAGVHGRTSPNYKDLFVNDLDSLGLGDFPSASQLTVNLVNSDEYTKVEVNDPLHENPRVINFNHGFAHLCDVHVLLLMDGQPPDGRLGQAVGGPGTPKKIVAVIVNKAACLGSRWKELEVANNVAHELGHSCNVQHHGEDNYDPGPVWKLGKDGKWYPLGQGVWQVAAPHMQNSGDQNCIMRYIRANYYEYPQGGYRWHDPNKPNGWIYGEPYGPAEQPGTIFCTQRVGTGVNGPDHKPVPKAGDATLGECARQICVNDLKH